MEFVKPEPKKVRQELAINVGSTTSTLLRLPASCAKDFMLNLAEMFNAGDIFARFGELIVDQNGITGINFPRTILDHMTIEPNASILDECFGIFAGNDHDIMTILVFEFEQTDRDILESFITEYYESVDNDYKPSIKCGCPSCSQQK